MTRKRSRFRHLPPTAVPVTTSDLQAGLHTSDSTIEKFHADLAAYLGVQTKACKLASSGRTALYCLLKGLKIKQPGRQQIIMPAYTCPAVARVAIDLKLQPIYVDLSCATMCYNHEHLAAAVNENTLAIVLVHPFGIPLPIDEVTILAQSVDAVVIEDAAQAMGARWDGQLVGTRGDFGLFSLGPGKPISTAGGGIAIANRPDGIPILNQGWDKLPMPGGLGSAQAWLRQAAFQLAFHPHGWWAATRAGLHRVGNHEASWGYNLTNLTTAQAGIGQALLPRLDEINAQRRRRAAPLKEAVKQLSTLQTIETSEEAATIYLRFPIITESAQQRENLFNQFWAGGIGVGRLYEETLPTIYKSNDDASFPGAEAIAHRLLTLPTHHYVTNSDLQAMGQILVEN